MKKQTKYFNVRKQLYGAVYKTLKLLLSSREHFGCQTRLPKWNTVLLMDTGAKLNLRHLTYGIHIERTKKIPAARVRSFLLHPLARKQTRIIFSP